MYGHSKIADMLYVGRRVLSHGSYTRDELAEYAEFSKRPPANFNRRLVGQLVRRQLDGPLPEFDFNRPAFRPLPPPRDFRQAQKKVWSYMWNLVFKFGMQDPVSVEQMKQVHEYQKSVPLFRQQAEAMMAEIDSETDASEFPIDQ